MKTNQNNKEKPGETKVANKKIKPNKKVIETILSNGFLVESLAISTTPSQTNDVSSNNTKHVHENNEEPKKNVRNKRNERKKKIKDKRKQNKEQNSIKMDAKIKSNSEKAKTKLKKPKLGEENTQSSDLTPEDMLSWAEFKIQEPIIKSLMELGFKKPTKIQQLSLPAAIHGESYHYNEISLVVDAHSFSCDCLRFLSETDVVSLLCMLCSLCLSGQWRSGGAKVTCSSLLASPTV